MTYGRALLKHARYFSQGGACSPGRHAENFIVKGFVKSMLQSPFCLLSRAHNFLWEVRLGISTRGIVNTNFPDARHYATLPYATIFRILERLCLTPQDVLVDVGSGKGRVLCCAARYVLREVVGVEIVQHLCEIAERNSRRLRGRKSPITIFNTAAQSYDYSNATVLTFFNPFGAKTLDAVLNRIEESQRKNPRPLRLAYANPEHDDVVQRRRWLERTDVWHKEAMAIQHSVVFYTSANGLL